MGLGVLKSVAAVAVGTLGSTLINKLLDNRTWTLFNIDTQETIKGQFPHDDMTREVGSSWEEINGLTRENPIQQFITGELETCELSAMFFRRDITDDSVNERIHKLISWTKVIKDERRPPLLQFAVGDGSAFNETVILKSLSRVVYSQPDFLGGIRQVNFTMLFWRYVPFTIADQVAIDTRFHRTASGQYYELIAAAEYGNPLLGDIIRRSDYQTGKPLLIPGDIVKLPAIEGIRNQRVAPSSTVLKDAYSKNTPQRRRREEILEARSQPTNLDIDGIWTF
jgi:hypothetical protein